MKKLLFILLLILSATYASAQINSRNLLLKSASQRELVETARSHQWSIDFTKREKDTILIVAVRVEFQADTSALTTGNGRFGMRGDAVEQGHYSRGDYAFDDLLHDSLYFANQLTALRNYYAKVSRGNLTLDFAVYPRRGGETGYQVPHQMTYYSPGWRRKTEKTDEYWDRKTHGLMMFIRDALRAADGDAGDSPFRNLYRDDSGILRDAATNRKAVILIFHAGASYLTDGGEGGSPNSPSDMIDAFINRDYFKFFKDTLGLDTDGVPVIGSQGEPFAIDEVMMSAETSNQDGLNWGIQGVLVNQMARQLGIPDLFSTSSGISAIGAFCIMDFAGYSAGQGFIPPYPSAWVRAFMGWDRPVAVGTSESPHRVKALTSVLDREGGGQGLSDSDTTILLIPINNNEYYLIENRQRNLSGDRSLFQYTDDDHIISAYPFNVNIKANVRSGSDVSNVILEAKNNDISLPASGALVWHVDERIIRQRLTYNFVNADSSYRGVRLVEADGKNDLGVTFSDAFYQVAFDYGGAEDVFPHRTTHRDGTVTLVNQFGPHSRPSTRSNDGGHSYLYLGFTLQKSMGIEKTLNFQNKVVENMLDSVFLITVRNDHLLPGWPKRAAPERFWDPLVTEINTSSPNGGNVDTVIAVLSGSGRLYLYPVNKNQQSYGDRTVGISINDYQNNTVATSLTATFFDSIPGTFTFPTSIENRILIPSTVNGSHRLHIYNSLNISEKSILTLPSAPTSYVCGIDARRWAVGLIDGRIIIGIDNGVTDTLSQLQSASSSPINALAALKDNAGGFAAIQEDGALSILATDLQIAASTKIPNGIAPFTIITGDLDNDGYSEMIISDSRQGIWVYTTAGINERKLELALGWKDQPNDWANTFHIDPEKQPGRARFPQNFSAPALADINRDGYLDIVLSGTNGVYALNRKGALLSRWPAYLDNRYWYERGSVTTSPIVVSTDRNHPLVLFSSPTGERATFGITKIEAADKERGVITFRRDDGTLDSLWDLSAATIDTVLTLGDSLIYPFILPGGFVDALNSEASRPVSKTGSWAVPQSRWPLSTGSSMATSPVAWRASAGSVPDIFAITVDGMVYRWKLDGMVSDSLYWPQNGFDAARSFAYGGARVGDDNVIRTTEPITFWNYPNPTSKDDPQTTFKYKFSGAAANVRLDIHSITGRRMDTFTMRDGLTGDAPDWNEFKVSLRKYGPGIYRCRMEATINGRKHVRMWKMAVVK